MHWFQSFCLPILLGIVTTALIFLLKELFFSVFIPRYREWIYSGLSITGTWKATYPADRDRSHIMCQEIMLVQQLGDRISGSIAYAEISGEPSSTVRQKQFKFRGTFVDSVLSAQYWSEDRADNGRGTFCLLVRDANKMIGKYSWLDPDTHNVEASDYRWTREAAPVVVTQPKRTTKTS
ncbi:MAG: hypothetical protein DMF72_21175 [Acidobacteria bacterium]|nr:MAG: hypothetical protein DMF72_21175 [Acidobacteriota bacterium]